MARTASNAAARGRLGPARVITDSEQLLPMSNPDKCDQAATQQAAKPCTSLGLVTPGYGLVCFSLQQGLLADDSSALGRPAVRVPFASICQNIPRTGLLSPPRGPPAEACWPPEAAHAHATALHQSKTALVATFLGFTLQGVRLRVQLQNVSLVGFIPSQAMSCQRFVEFYRRQTTPGTWAVTITQVSGSPSALTRSADVYRHICTAAGSAACRC